MSHSKLLLATVTILLLAAPFALAHEREYTLSRDWFLPYKGESEVESRTFWDTRHNIATQEFEYEYGVTDWFGIEPGIEFVKDKGGDFELEAVDCEFRFHFGTFAYDKFLPALNVEYEHPTEGDEKDRGELKLILSRYGQDGQDFTLNLNGGTELTSNGESESEMTFGYVRPFRSVDASSSAYFRDEPRFGVEAIHDFHESFNGLGPLFVYRGTKHLNMLASYVFGLNEREENADELRVILEWEF
jgi:hypothetical protein